MIVTLDGIYEYVAREFTREMYRIVRSNSGLRKDDIKAIVELVAEMRACPHDEIEFDTSLQAEYSKGWCAKCGASDEDKTCAR